MADSALIDRVPCPVPGCDGAGDNAARYADGSVKCHACGAKWITEEEYEQALGCSEGSGDGGPVDLTGEQGPPPVLVPHIKAFPNLGLTYETCERYGYGVVEHLGRGWQAAPYYDASGRPVLWKLRDQHKEFLQVGDRSRAQTFFGQKLQGAGRMVVLTEGEKDAMSVSQALGNRWPAWSLRDGAGNAAKEVARELGALEKFERVVLAFDMDDPGRTAAEACAKLLTPGKAFIASYPLKDANEMLKAHRGDELRAAIWNAPEWKPRGILEGDTLFDAIKGKWRPAVAAFPYPELQRMTRGIRPAEIVLLAAASGGGKSTLSRTLAWKFVEAGLKVGIVTLEETIDQFMVPFVGYAMDPPRNLRVVDEDPTQAAEFEAAFTKVRERVVAFDDDGRRDPDTIFDLIRYMKLARGCDVVFLDHLTVILGGGRGKNEEGLSFTDRLMSRLEVLVKRTRVTLVLVTHLRKVGTQSRSYAEGGQISLDDIKGSSLIGDLSHTVIVRERDQQSNEGGHLRLLKCRLSGTGELGEADRLRFVPETGMIVADDDPAERLMQAAAVEEVEAYV